MTEIRIFDAVGELAENKDVARDMRLKIILPALAKGDEVILNFSDVKDATQSFVHALISDAIRQHGVPVLDRIGFKNCNDSVKEIIEIVVGYMQNSADLWAEDTI